jgi:hypothetical protein
MLMTSQWHAPHRTSLQQMNNFFDSSLPMAYSICLFAFPNSQKHNGHASKQNNGVRKYCKFCEKDGYTEERCFSVEKVERKLKAAKARINEVQDDSNDKSNQCTPTKN